MSQPTPSPPPRSRSRSSTMIIAAVIMAISGVALLHQWLVAAPRRACEDLLAAIRARGEPVTMEDLAPAPAAGEDNAALLYQRAFGLYVQPTPETGDHQDALATWTSNGRDGDPPTQEALEALAGWLRSNEPVFALISQAATRPRCVFPVDWSAGINMDMDHLSPLKDLSRLTLTAVDLALARGDPTASLAACQTALALTNALNEEPTLISWLVRASLASTALDRLTAALDAGARPTEMDARILAQQLQSLDDRQTFERCTIGERAFGLSAFAVVEGGDAPTVLGLPDNAMNSLYPHTMLARDKLHYLKAMEAALEATRTSPEKQLIADLDTAMKKHSWGLNQINVITWMMMPNMQIVATRQLSLQRQARQLALDLAAIRYHTRHGVSPDSVDTLVKDGLLEAMPLDAHGEPMELFPPATAGNDEGR